MSKFEDTALLVEAEGNPTKRVEESQVRNQKMIQEYLTGLYAYGEEVANAIDWLTPGTYTAADIDKQFRYRYGRNYASRLFKEFVKDLGAILSIFTGRCKTYRYIKCGNEDIATYAISVFDEIKRVEHLIGMYPSQRYTFTVRDIGIVVASTEMKFLTSSRMKKLVKWIDPIRRRGELCVSFSLRNGMVQLMEPRDHQFTLYVQNCGNGQMPDIAFALSPEQLMRLHGICKAEVYYGVWRNQKCLYVKFTNRGGRVVSSTHMTSQRYTQVVPPEHYSHEQATAEYYVNGGKSASSGRRSNTMVDTH